MTTLEGLYSGKRLSLSFVLYLEPNTGVNKSLPAKFFLAKKVEKKK
jgi:hypothetical protein